MAARCGLNARTLRLLCIPAQIIQIMAFAQIIDIWRPGRSMEDHLKNDVILGCSLSKPYMKSKRMMFFQVMSWLIWFWYAATKNNE